MADIEGRRCLIDSRRLTSIPGRLAAKRLPPVGADSQGAPTAISVAGYELRRYGLQG